MSLILALDAGTTSLKGSLFDLSGRVLGAYAHEYQLENPEPDIVELDPEVYWSAAKSVIANILQKTAVDPAAIIALGVTGQGETLIVLDKQGRPLRKAIVWLDNRAKAEAEAIRKEFGRDLVYRMTGQPEIVPAWPAAKMVWLREHEPEVFKSTGKFLMLEDYLIYRLSGTFATDHALNPSTLYYDLRNGCWWERMLDFLRVSPCQLPTLLNSGACAGSVVAETGLSHETAVTVVPIDQVAAAVGAGNIAPGLVTETTGGALAVCATVARPVYDPKMRIPIYRHGVPGLFLLMPWIPTAGMILRWFRDEFGEGMDYSELDTRAATVSPGCAGLIMLPHFSGMNSPEVNPRAKGVFWGISTAHRKAHFIRAILEGISFALRDNIELLLDFGVACQELTSLGGGARSKLWLQIKADTLQREIKTIHCEEATCLGAAVLAATGTGLFANVGSAITAMIHPSATFHPNIRNKEIYEAGFKTYRGLNQRAFSV